MNQIKIVDYIKPTNEKELSINGINIKTLLSVIFGEEDHFENIIQEKKPENNCFLYNTLINLGRFDLIAQFLNKLSDPSDLSSDEIKILIKGVSLLNDIAELNRLRQYFEKYINIENEKINLKGNHWLKLYISIAIQLFKLGEEQTGYNIINNISNVSTKISYFGDIVTFASQGYLQKIEENPVILDQNNQEVLNRKYSYNIFCAKYKNAIIQEIIHNLPNKSSQNSILYLEKLIPLLEDTKKAKELIEVWYHQYYNTNDIREFKEYATKVSVLQLHITKSYILLCAKLGQCDEMMDLFQVIEKGYESRSIRSLKKEILDQGLTDMMLNQLEKHDEEFFLDPRNEINTFKKLAQFYIDYEKFERIEYCLKSDRLDNKQKIIFTTAKFIVEQSNAQKLEYYFKSYIEPLIHSEDQNEVKMNMIIDFVSLLLKNNIDIYSLNFNNWHGELSTTKAKIKQIKNSQSLIQYFLF